MLAKSPGQKLAGLDFVAIEALLTEQFILSDDSAEENDSVPISLFHELRVVLKNPWVAPIAHQSDLALAADKEHDVAACFILFLVDPSLGHLGVTDEVDEFPFAQVDHLLNAAFRKMHDDDLSVLRREMFVSEEGILHGPLSTKWSLWILEGVLHLPSVDQGPLVL